MMLSRVLVPKSKAELIRALEKASFRSFEVFEGPSLESVSRIRQIAKAADTLIVLRGSA